MRGLLLGGVSRNVEEEGYIWGLKKKKKKKSKAHGRRPSGRGTWATLSKGCLDLYPLG